ncbi:hypothetical protein [Priestia megaterium]|uniref:hypothetical protein n=1 Tax=Priestia megaterium TaxID=1404 RepID=UPI0023643D6A|nr:hypothetical protein [Priestia megaterium]MDD1515916.1 hypothetical protein [Priestia megaterium]
MSKKKKLASFLTKELELLGFREDKNDEILIYRKKVADKFLSIGFSFYRFEPNKFFLDFYLSDSCIFGLLFADFPSNAYKRLTDLLTEDQKEKLKLDDLEFMDINDLNEEYIKNLIFYIEKAEHLFLEQENLFEEIDNSTDLKKRNLIVNEVFNAWKNSELNIEQEVSKYQSKIKILELRELFQTAMVMLKEKKVEEINNELAYDIALDAYRRNLLD